MTGPTFNSERRPRPYPRYPATTFNAEAHPRGNPGNAGQFTEATAVDPGQLELTNTEHLDALRGAYESAATYLADTFADNGRDSWPQDSQGIPIVFEMVDGNLDVLRIVDNPAVPEPLPSLAKVAAHDINTEPPRVQWRAGSPRTGWFWGFVSA